MLINTVTPSEFPWQPNANTIAYYPFDDQNANQITDSSGNNKNLTGGSMPGYTLVSGTNYAGNFTTGSGNAPSNSSYGPMNGTYTVLCWVKPTGTSASYINYIGFINSSGGHHISLIRGYNSGQFEYFDDMSGGSYTKRTSILTGASINNWYLIGYTRNGTSVATYANGVSGNTITGNNSTTDKNFYVGSANEGWRFPGLIDSFIVENKVWTAQEVLDYYNSTKSNYGL